MVTEQQQKINNLFSPFEIHLTTSSNVCRWTERDQDGKDNVWLTECGNTIYTEITNTKTKEGKFPVFCPVCGKKVEKAWWRN
jgi:hypothetical protein